MERDTSFARSAMAGAGAAGAATAVFHPVDTVKTVLQQTASAGRAANMIHSLGVPGLYRGVLPAVLSMAPACAVRMGTYEAIKAPLLRSDRAQRALPPTLLVASASAASVVASAAVRCPLDMVKTQLQVAPGSTLGTLRAAWRSGGVAGLYRGAGIALMRDLPFFSVNLALYERLKAAALSARPAVTAGATPAGAGSSAGCDPMGGCAVEPQLTAGDTLLIGAVAQGVAGFATNPIDVLKTRVQVRNTVVMLVVVTS